MNATQLSPSVLFTTRLSSLLSLRLDEVCLEFNHGIGNGTRVKYFLLPLLFMCLTARCAVHACKITEAS